MKVFVSYIRRENPMDRLKWVAEIAASLGSPHVDDLVDHRGADRHSNVVAALRTADAFVAVVTPSYPATVWTSWEFGVAKARGIPRFALLPDGELVASGTSRWPWTEAEEAAMLGSADVTEPPLPNLCGNAPAGVG
ncbi:hypothetical protein Lesp02_54990 [Lentzea sp. NBRC 105346]|uniref:TIR domain-containing protein n=1 Tax=Lentzea sp. NBRC 105346 TaxID=3032205 RepID=UPI0024A10603|nr:TIR domain-containing protein [Lentzea sp. NBRC 105346]GLZ33311.1 hypothetical protein Lesp02_54990 [Lentzea sp. NBRC 105346]